MDCIGFDWIGLDRIRFPEVWVGLDWMGMGRIGLDWVGLDWALPPSLAELPLHSSQVVITEARTGSELKLVRKPPKVF